MLAERRERERREREELEAESLSPWTGAVDPGMFDDERPRNDDGRLPDDGGPSVDRG